MQVHTKQRDSKNSFLKLQLDHAGSKLTRSMQLSNSKTNEQIELLKSENSHLTEQVARFRAGEQGQSHTASVLQHELDSVKQQLSAEQASHRLEMEHLQVQLTHERSNAESLAAQLRRAGATSLWRSGVLRCNCSPRSACSWCHWWSRVLR